MNPAITNQLLQLTSVSFPSSNREELEMALARYINDLIISDFSKLVALLYRVDVSEKKLKSLLKEYPDTEAGLIIAKLIIERQDQKLATRKKFDQRTSDSDEERW